MTHPRSATPPQGTEIPATLGRLAELVAAGKFTAAHRAAAALIDHSDPHTLGLIARCAQALQADRDTATAALDELWLHATERDAAIITACLPAADYTPDLPTPDAEPAWKRQVRWVPPSRVRIRRGPITPQPHPSAANTATAGHLPDTDGLSADDREMRGRPIGYELDYDLAALHPLRGTPCVGCWIERSRTDQNRPDGLCTECRDAGHPGIPTLPAGHTRADAIQARCQHIADTDTTGHGGLPTLRAEYRRANVADRAIIAAWVTDQQT